MVFKLKPCIVLCENITRGQTKVSHSEPKTPNHFFGVAAPFCTTNKRLHNTLKKDVEIQLAFKIILSKLCPDIYPTSLSILPHDEKNLRTSFARNNANWTNTNKKFVRATSHCSTKANPSVSVEDS